MNDKEKNKVKLPPVYNPAKQYEWPNDAVFELTGYQFGLWLNSVRNKVNTAEAKEFVIAFQASDAIEEIMARGVESGLIEEKVQKPQNPPMPKV